jgi:hypothetical protein
MMKFIHPLAAFGEFFGGCLMVVWSSALKPHPLALKKFGIRVVAPKNYGSMDDHADVYTALLLLNRFGPKELEQVEKYIRIIFLREVDGPSLYLKTGRICHLTHLKECPAGVVPIMIAGTLVYLAALAKFKRGFVTSEGVHDICRGEKQRIVDKLSKELCE